MVSVTRPPRRIVRPVGTITVVTISWVSDRRDIIPSHIGTPDHLVIDLGDRQRDFRLRINQRNDLQLENDVSIINVRCDRTLRVDPAIETRQRGRGNRDALPGGNHSASIVQSDD